MAHATNPNAQSTASLSMELSKELDRYREKLLDLSNRNSLLNYRKTLATIQVVDEMPDQIFERLVSLKRQFRFQADEEEEPESFSEQSSCSTEPEPTEPPSIAEQGEAPQSTGEDKRAGRRRHHLSRRFSIELPDPHTTPVSGQHEDDILQTNVFGQEKLESLLKTIAHRAKGIIEETGVNYLHLVLGSLNWNDPGKDSALHLAPLLLIPVQLERIFDKRSARYTYKLEWTEEEILHNLSLERKLEREFAIQLPKLDQDQTPEDYFRAVREAVNSRPEWQVCRESFIGFFSFHKLLMYLDANPDNWSGKTGAELSVAEAIVLGQEQVDAGTAIYAGEYPIDEDPAANKIPLIVDADSSQHSALYDIIKGRSLVIEGPPGTGKSQTITNAIAAIIHQGKSVLFVAEKLAALKVVESKLNSAGLGEFCLAIHSDDASPRQVIDSLRKRMDRTYPEPHQIGLLRSQLEQSQKELNQYLQLQRSPIGPHNETVDELQWRVIAASQSETPRLEDPSIIPIPGQAEFDANRIQIKTFEAMLSELGDPRKSPWWGFSANCVAPDEQAEIISTLREMLSGAKRLLQQLESCNAMFGGDFKHWIEQSDVSRISILEHIRSFIPSISAGFDWGTLSAENHRSSVKDLVQDLRTAREIEGALSECPFATTQLPAEDADSTRKFIDYYILPWGGDFTFGKLQETIAWLNECLSILKGIQGASAEMGCLDCGPIRQIGKFRTLTEALYLALKIPREITGNIAPELFSKGGAEYFRAAKRVSDQFIADQDMIHRNFYSDSIPDEASILNLERRLRPFNGNWFRWFFPEFYKARNALFQFARPELGNNVSNWLRSLEVLRLNEQKKEAFKNNSEFKDIFGNAFNGVHTNWHALESLVNWVDHLRNAGFDYAQGCRILHEARAFESKRLQYQALTADFEKTFAQDKPLPALGIDSPSINIEFQELEARASTLRDKLAGLKEFLCSIKTDETATVSKIRNFMEQVVTLHSTLEQLKRPDHWYTRSSWFRGMDTDIEELTAALDLMHALFEFEIPAGLDELLAKNHSPTQIALQLCEICKTIAEERQLWEKNREQLRLKGALADDWLNLNSQIDRDPICVKHLETLLSASEDLPRWCTLMRALTSCRQNGLGDFLNGALTGGVPQDRIAAIYEKTVYENLIAQFLRENPSLHDFSRQKHEQLRNAYQEADRRLIQLNRQLVASQLSKRQPPPGSARGRVAEYNEMGLIRHEVQKSSRHCRIRDLLLRAGRSVQTLKPCFMMSPLSVSQYLPPEGLQFDVVIMDEASQIKPEDAMGSVLRARQLIVVGDPKQMPPSAFFDRVEEEVDQEEASQMDNTESILEVASKTFQPLRRLRWHYRSRHEHLIEFSNQQFYDRDLVVFPSPGKDRGRLGVFLHQIEDGYFKNGENVVEAERVVEAIIQHARHAPQESLGVGTLNLKQARLISDLLDQRCERDQEARTAMERLDAEQAHEKFFIKNLENLQGDERDVVLISFTYGKDPATGRVFRRFGPMNSAVGWRRFNVLITRARKRLEVFSSLRAIDIEGGASSSRGVNAMRDFLEFCQSKQTSEGGVEIERTPQSDFECAMGQVISGAGLHYVPQVGVAGCFIDLGVLHPNSEGDFLMGIECDTSASDTSKSARDRYRLRPEVMANRGWKIHRVSSLDWFRNQKHEVERLRSSLEPHNSA